MSDGDEALQDLRDACPLFIIAAGLDEDPRLFFAGAKECVNPAAGAVPGEETVLRRNPPEHIIDGAPDRIRAVEDVKDSPVDDNNQYPFPVSFFSIPEPERAILFIAIGVEEFTVKGILAFLELVQKEPRFQGEAGRVPGLYG